LFKQSAFIFIFLISCNQISQKSYINFFLKTYEPKQGDLIFQDLDSSPLCDAIEAVTPGVFNQNFSHVGMIIKHENNYHIIEAFSQGVKIVTIEEFLKRSIDENGIPKITIARIDQKTQKLNPHIIDRINTVSTTFLNTPYDEYFLLENNSFYCSEFLYQVFKEANNGKDFFELAPMTFKNSDGEFSKIWKDYFKKLEHNIPEGMLGINPGKMTLNKHLKYIYNYKNPNEFISNNL